jgi:hypothetical protein
MGHVAPAQQVALIHQNGPMALLEMAVKNQSAIDVIERLAVLQREERASQAELEFNDAMNAAQGEIGLIVPDLNNPQTRSRYASYKTLKRAVRPVYSRHGFSLSFNTADCPLPEHVRVICYVSRGRHTRNYQIDMPCDGKGAKGGDVMTKTHAAGSANSYGKRYLLLDIFNIAVGEHDDDGNAAGAGTGPKKLDDLVDRLDAIGSSRSRDELMTISRKAYNDAQALQDKDSMREIVAARDRRKKELGLD